VKATTSEQFQSKNVNPIGKQFFVAF